MITKKYMRDYCKNYYLKNRDRLLKKQKNYYRNNKDTRKKYAKDYRKLNSKRIAKLKHDWFQNNKEKIYEDRKNEDYRLLNRIYGRIKRNRKRAIIELFDNYTEEEWKGLKQEFNFKCAYCKKRKKLEPDHVIPLSKGGNDLIGNILPSCRNCNASKNNKILEEWDIVYGNYIKNIL